MASVAPCRSPASIRSTTLPWPSAPTNLTRHHAIDLNLPIGCGGVPVFPDDIVVGDDEVAVIVLAGIADEIAEEATRMTLFEAWKAARGIRS